MDNIERVIVDIKGTNGKIMEIIEEFYNNQSVKIREQTIFCSFNRKILEKLSNKYKKGTTFETTFKDDEYDLLTSNFSAVVMHWTCLDRNLIEYCKIKGIETYVFTHKEDMELKYMHKYDVNYIITNGFI